MAKTADDQMTRDATAGASEMDMPEPEPAAPGEDQPAPMRPPASTPVAKGRRTRLRSVGPRRTRVTIRHVGIWSVFKFSILFFLCAMLVIWLALLIIYLVLEAGGTIDTLGDNLACLVNEPIGTKECPPVQFDGRVIFTYLFLAGLVLAFAWSLIATFIAVVYNLIADLVGGFDITLSEKPRG